MSHATPGSSPSQKSCGARLQWRLAGCSVVLHGNLIGGCRLRAVELLCAKAGSARAADKSDAMNMRFL